MTVGEIRRTVEPICRRYQVERLELFGSTARGEAKANSDIDLCVMLKELPPSEYSKQFFGLLHDLEDAFHSTVDLLTANSIQKPSLRRSLQSEGIRIYG